MQKMIMLGSLAALLLCWASPSHALPTCDDWMNDRVEISDQQYLTLDTAALQAAGVTIETPRRMRARDYPWEHYVQVALPPSYNRDRQRRYPVLWVMDGQFFFDTAAEIATSCANEGMPEMIVVAIGATPEADRARNEIQSRRTYDFSPTSTPTTTGFGGEIWRRRTEEAARRQRERNLFTTDRMGGAPQFLAFIAGDVRQELQRAYRMSDDHTLFGHSGGGVFCGYALFANPAAFKRYICGSPAWTANDYELFRMEERHAGAHTDLDARVFMGAGEGEVLQLMGIVSSMAQMAELLDARNYPSLKLSVRIFPHENHLNAVPRVISAGLKAVWETPTPAPATAQPAPQPPPRQ